MTLQEVKASHSVIDLARSYGIRINASRMARCPFHSGDRTASLLIDKDHFHCFGCGAHGDVIDFVCMMESVDFKTAFLQLGGSYDEDPEQLRKDVRKAETQREIRGLLEESNRIELRAVCDEITRLRSLPDAEEPFSDTWCALIEEDLKLRMIEDEYSERQNRT